APAGPGSLTAAVDLDPDPNIVSIAVEAKLAKVSLDDTHKPELWTYNGLVPGPLVRAKKGDTLVVSFTNQLPEPTLIHWHGVRVPAAMDGNGTLEAQSPVQPGESFDYRFPLPDAGLFWFHTQEDAATQVEKGLYAPILVADPDEPAFLAQSQEMVL